MVFIDTYIDLYIVYIYNIYLYKKKLFFRYIIILCVWFHMLLLLQRASQYKKKYLTKLNK